MRDLTKTEQSIIGGGSYDGNEKLEKGRFFVYDIGGAILGAMAGAQAASLMDCNLLGRGIGLMVGAAGGTIFGQVLSKIVTTTGRGINE